MLFSLLMGGMVRRFGSVRVSQGGVMLVAAGMACAATASPAGLLLSAPLMGVGVATVTPAASNLILRFTPVEKLGTGWSLRPLCFQVPRLHHCISMCTHQTYSGS